MNRPFVFFFPFLLITGLYLASTVHAQTPADTINHLKRSPELVKKHSPTTASLYSALVPGLGQIYNKKWWKVPIIYAGFGVMTYFIVTNADEYLNYRCALIEKQYGNLNGNYADLVKRYTADELNSAAEYYRRNLEVSILITSVWYILNIIDATVDAHLYTYTISDDLSLRVSPDILPSGRSLKPQPGIRLCLKF